MTDKYGRKDTRGRQTWQDIKGLRAKAPLPLLYPIDTKQWKSESDLSEAEWEEREKRYDHFLASNQRASSFRAYMEAKQENYLTERDGETWKGEPFHAVCRSGAIFGKVRKNRLYALTVQLVDTMRALRESIPTEEATDIWDYMIDNGKEIPPDMMKKLNDTISASDPDGLLSDFPDEWLKGLLCLFAWHTISAKYLTVIFDPEYTDIIKRVHTFFRIDNIFDIQFVLFQAAEITSHPAPEDAVNLIQMFILGFLICLIENPIGYTDEFGPMYGVWPDGTECERTIIRFSTRIVPDDEDDEDFTDEDLQEMLGDGEKEDEGKV